MGPLPSGRSTRAAQWALRVLWGTVLPALLAMMALRFGSPPLGSAAILAGILLFFLFAGLISYWRFYIPGGRYASPLPANVVVAETDPEKLATWAQHASLYQWLGSRRFQRWLARSCDAVTREAIQASITELRGAFDTGDLSTSDRASQSLRSLAAKAWSTRKRIEAIGLFSSVAVAAALATFLRAHVAESYVVLSGSMLPTLEPGDRLAGYRLAYAKAPPRRGDVIVFRSASVSLGARGASAPDLLVKRVIGLPGDRIAMRGGVPIVNAQPVPYCDAGIYTYVPHDGDSVARGKLRVEYLDDEAYLTLNALSLPFDEVYVVKPGEVFVLGDNRSNSLDSRAWNDGHGGGVPLGAIEARGQWFLVGTHRSGEADLGRFMRSIDTLGRSIHVEGLDTRTVEDGVRRCLESRPRDAHPPDPNPLHVSNTSFVSGG